MKRKMACSVEILFFMAFPFQRNSEACRYLFLIGTILLLGY
uniref:Uncharacterized protein n=1 Tax=Anguilla anguilla TaxID=7936 RepID=A0A0E9T015_ANGAN